MTPDICPNCGAKSKNPSGEHKKLLRKTALGPIWGVTYDTPREGPFQISGRYWACASCGVDSYGEFPRNN